MTSARFGGPARLERCPAVLLRRLVVIAAVGLAFGGAMPGQTPAPAGQPAGVIQWLERGRTVEGQLSSGQSRSYGIRVQAGQFVHVVVQQKGIGIFLSLSDSAGNVLAQSYRYGEYGPVPVSTIAEHSGDLRLELITSPAGAPAGKYEVRLTGLRAPTTADQARIRAENTYMEGTSLYAKGSADAKTAAQAKWEQSAQLWHSLGDKVEEAFAWNEIGVVYSDLGDMQKALGDYNRALPLQRAARDRGGQATTLDNIGRAYDDLGEKQKALDAYDRALPLERRLGDRGGEAMTLNGSGRAHDDLGQKQKALDDYNKALPIERAAGDSNLQAITLNNIGAVYAALGEKQTALDYFNQALPLRRAAGNGDGQAVTLNNIGGVYSDLGQNEKALEYYNQALPLERAAADRGSEATTLSNVGHVYSSLGEKQKALDDYNQALPLERAAGDRRGEAITLNNLGRVYDDLGEKQKALEYYNQALPLERAVADRSSEAGTLSNVGVVYDALGKQQAALDYYNQALPLQSAVGDRDGQAITLHNMGWTYGRLGQHQKALDDYNQALPLERAAGDRGGQAATLREVGQVYDELGQKQMALTFYSQALPLFQAVQDPLGESTVLARLMDYQRSAGNAPLAIFFGKQAVDRLQQVRRNLEGLQRADQQSFLESKQDEYKELAGLLIDAGRLPEAQQILDLMKLDEYSDYSEHRGAPASAVQPVEYTDAEAAAKAPGDQIGARITALGLQWAALKARLGTLSPDEKKQYDQLGAELSDANSKMTAYIAGLASSGQFAGSANAIAAANQSVNNVKGEIGDLKVQLARLEPGTVAIYTLVLPDRLAIILITPQTMVSEDVPTSAIALRSQVNDFTRLFAGAQPPDEQAVKAKGQALYQTLFPAKIQAELDSYGARTIMWALYDVLRYVPMAALWDGHEYLVARYRNVLITTSRSRLTEDPQLAGAQGVAMGISKVYTAADNLPALGFVPGELDAVVRSAQVAGSDGPIQGNILLNDSFTEKNMKEALAGELAQSASGTPQASPKVIHIASHYVFAPGSDMNSYLLLGGKDTGGEGFRLTLEEFDSDPAIDFSNAELVTFSACQTALSQNDADGHEVDGLGIAAIQDKQAKAVMATLWNVNDQSQAKLTAEFYRRWLGPPGMNKAEALRQAQLCLLNGCPSVGPGYSNPYYWAPFILIGNWK